MPGIDWYAWEQGVLELLRRGGDDPPPPPPPPGDRSSLVSGTYYPGDPSMVSAPDQSAYNAAYLAGRTSGESFGSWLNRTLTTTGMTAPRPILANVTGPTAAQGDLDFVDGDLTVLKSNAVLSGLYVNGTIKLGGYSDPDISNMVIRGTDARVTNTCMVTGNSDNLRGAVLTDVLMEGRGNPYVDGLRGSNWTAIRCEIKGTSDAIGLSGQVGNTRWQQGWIHDAQYYEWEEPQSQYGDKTYPSTPQSTQPARTFTATIGSGSTSLTGSGSAFVNSDTGRAITVAGAGVGGSTLTTTVAAVVSATQVTLAAPASTSALNSSTTLASRRWGFYTHNDGVQFFRGKNNLILGSTIGGLTVPGDHNVYPSQQDAIRSGTDYYNSGILLDQAYDASNPANWISDCRIEDNLFIGGRCGLNITTQYGQVWGPDMVIAGNQWLRQSLPSVYREVLFGASARFGHASYNEAVAAFLSTNTIYQTGAPVTVTKGA